MRAKWSAPIRKYWKISEQMMVKYCDLAICDSVNIEKYIHECYDGKGIQGSSPKTTFIAYGADLTLSKLADDDEKLMNWYREKGLTKKDYYLVVGRFVPENSFEVMIREFMKSKSKKNFAIITNVNAEYFNGKTIDKIRSEFITNRQNHFEEGTLTHRQAKYGYALSEDRRSLVLNPESAQVVKLIFQMYLEDMKIPEIARALDVQGVQTPQVQMAKKKR